MVQESQTRASVTDNTIETKNTNRAAQPLYLPRRLDPLDHGEANHRPGDQQAHGHFPVESSTLRDVVRDVQGLTVPVVGGG